MPARAGQLHWRIDPDHLKGSREQRNEEEAEIDIPAVQKEIEQLEGELAEVQVKMKEYLKLLGY